MKKQTLLLLFGPLVLLATAVLVAEDFENLLGFEASHTEGTPFGWAGNPLATLFIDDQIVHGGKWSAGIERTTESAGSFSALSKSIPVNFVGDKLELRGFLRTEGVAGWAGLWLREDGEDGVVAFDNMQKRQLRGTTEWTEYRIVLPLGEAARTTVFGALLSGEGKLWVDDLQLLVDGKPVSEAPKVERVKTVLDTDQEFDDGSGIEVSALSPVQTSNLAVLGKVWGFLKYHHPHVTGGQVHWDYELFRVLPRVLEAADRPSANAALLAWAKGLGDVAPGERRPEQPDDLHIQPDLDWIHDVDVLGGELSNYLERIHRDRQVVGSQFYVSLQRGVGNPEFSNEKAYRELEKPDVGFRILSLFRVWNIIQYWFPYRDIIGEDWHAVLPEFLPRMVAADDPDAYQLELLTLISRVHDGHANLWSSLAVRPPRGGCQLPVRLRFVEDAAVVVGYTHPEKGPACGLEIGDVVLALDGTAVDSLRESWKRYYAASNDTRRLFDVAHSMTRGECGECAVRGERATGPFELKAKRLPVAGLELRAGGTHDLSGETFRLLSPDVAYLTLSSVKIADVDKYLEGAKGTRGLVIDIRNYPSEFMVFALGQHLVSEPTPFARFTIGDLANPGAFHWRDPPLVLNPINPRYEGKVVILIDEVSQSQAEYTSMAFRSAPGAIVVGSTTAGTDGNVSQIPLPGGLRTMISGIGVFYPDKTPTQRVGIVPDVEARPTIRGIRQGRDEVLEVALRQILGDDMSAEELRTMIHPIQVGASKRGGQ